MVQKGDEFTQISKKLLGTQKNSHQEQKSTTVHRITQGDLEFVQVLDHLDWPDVMSFSQLTSQAQN